MSHSFMRTYGHIYNYLQLFIMKGTVKFACPSTKGCQIGKSLTVACNFSKSLRKDLCFIPLFVQKPLNELFSLIQRLL